MSLCNLINKPHIKILIVFVRFIVIFHMAFSFAHGRFVFSKMPCLDRLFAFGSYFSVQSSYKKPLKPRYLFLKKRFSPALVQTQRHRNRKYITYRNATRGGPSHSRRYPAQKSGKGPTYVHTILLYHKSLLHLLLIMLLIIINHKIITFEAHH